jgi:hypothetical protein
VLPLIRAPLRRVVPFEDGSLGVDRGPAARVRGGSPNELSADRSGIFIAVSQLPLRTCYFPHAGGSSESVGAPRRPSAFIIV